MVHCIDDKIPDIHPETFIAWNAEVSGDVVLSAGSSVWFSATIRADIAPVSVGENTNIQDNAVLHADPETPCSIGSNCTVGHGAILHACTIEDDCLIGMGAIVLNDARIGKGSVVGAGALVQAGKSFAPGSLIVGSPARCMGTVSPEDIDRIRKSAEHYRNAAMRAKTAYREMSPVSR